MNNETSKVFLTAEWRFLAMLNFEIEPSVLTPFVPAGTELDSWQGKYFVSAVGFLFLNTKVWGISIPFHRHFEEVNLRFYVRQQGREGWRRGVVFIKELVPRAAIAFLARALYHEPYLALPMAHRLELEPASPRAVEYSWRFGGRQNRLQLTVRGGLENVPEDSAAEFITEHYWGYTTQPNGTTLEYRVEHPRWRVWFAESAQLDCAVAELYGPQFKECLSRPPASAFLAEGSAVTVSRGVRLAA